MSRIEDVPRGPETVVWRLGSVLLYYKSIIRGGDTIIRGLGTITWVVGLVF